MIIDLNEVSCVAYKGATISAIYVRGEKMYDCGDSPTPPIPPTDPKVKFTTYNGNVVQYLPEQLSNDEVQAYTLQYTDDLKQALSENQTYHPYVDSQHLKYARNLKSVVDQTGKLSIIGNSSFFGIDVQNVDCSGVISVGETAFWQCNKLTSLNIPNVNFIGYAALDGCTCLSTVKIDSSNEKYTALDVTGEETENGKLIKDKLNHSIVWASIPECEEVSLPSDVNSIGDAAFSQCINLTRINTENILYIAGNAFSYCSSLNEIDCRNLTYLGNNAFSRSGLTSISIPSIKNVELMTFACCNKLVSANCDQVSSFGNSAFTRCSVLTSIYCPNVIKFGAYSFSECSNLKNIYCINVDNAPELDGNALQQIHNDFTIWVKPSAYDAFINAESWKNISSHISAYAPQLQLKYFGTLDSSHAVQGKTSEISSNFTEQTLASLSSGNEFPSKITYHEGDKQVFLACQSEQYDKTKIYKLYDPAHPYQTMYLNEVFDKKLNGIDYTVCFKNNATPANDTIEYNIQQEDI